MKLRIYDHVGAVAEDKDQARRLRQEVIVPAIARGTLVVLDFEEVGVVTQSFVHACIAEALQRWGQDALARLEFRSCTDDAREVITTVVQYSVRAHALASQAPLGQIETADIPQANSLHTLRVIIDAMASGDLYLLDLQRATGYSYRHLNYRLHAARTLGLVKMNRSVAVLTEAGFRLAETKPGGTDERVLLTKAIRESAVVRAIAPQLLSERRSPSTGEIAGRIARLTGLSEQTAKRRAQTLVSWRRQLLERQQALPFVR